MAAHEHRRPTLSDERPPGRHLILWDGECGFCRQCVDWAMANDRRGVLAEMPYQEVPSPPMTPELRDACRQSVHVVTADGRLLRAGRACLFVLEELGWRRLAAVGRMPPFLWLVEAGYRFVANHRPLVSRLLGNRVGRAAHHVAANPTSDAAPRGH